MMDHDNDAAHHWIYTPIPQPMDKMRIYIPFTIWLFNIAMENPPIFKFGKPSISMGHFPWLC